MFFEHNMSNPRKRDNNRILHLQKNRSPEHRYQIPATFLREWSQSLVLADLYQVEAHVGFSRGKHQTRSSPLDKSSKNPGNSRRHTPLSTFKQEHDTLSRSSYSRQGNAAAIKLAVSVKIRHVSELNRLKLL